MLVRWMRPMVALVCMAVLASAAAGNGAPQQSKGPCTSKLEYRQLDYWVGEWDVLDKQQKIATSSIQRIVGDCVIFENYTQPDGYHGKSVNFFDATLGKWRQTWVDAAGNVSEFVGEYREDAMRFEGETHLGDGTKVLRRMTLSRLGPDRVRQFSERSTDGGATWSVAYDFEYRRRK
jgi:hypothetical protein